MIATDLLNAQSIEYLKEFSFFSQSQSLHDFRKHSGHNVELFNTISPLTWGRGRFRPPWETFLNNSKTAQDIEMKFFKFNLTPFRGHFAHNNNSH